MKVGTICYATDQGLGYLAKAFYDNGVVNKPFVLQHSSRNTHWNWYPECEANAMYRSHAKRIELHKIRALINTVDIMFFFETPFDWSLIDYCKKVRTKSVLMPMYECMPKELPYEPDYYICPSLLDYQYYPYNNSTFIPVPVSVPWSFHSVANKFVHNAGHGGLNGRNGTRELIEALHHTTTDVSITIRTQAPGMKFVGWDSLVSSGKLKLEFGTQPYDTLYNDCDVFVFPEKFNGLSLPLQEAHASGLAVMCTNRYPMNTWLPTEPMIPMRTTIDSEVSGRCNVFKQAVIEPEDIAATLDAWYGKSIAELSLDGRRYAEDNSWEVLKPRYIKVLEQLL